MIIHICTSTTVADIEQDGYRFDFSEQFGPLFLTKKGEPLKNQPMPKSRAWKAFDKWYALYIKDRTAAGTVPRRESSKG